jgi:hypothetical protein
MPVMNSVTFIVHDVLQAEGFTPCQRAYIGKTNTAQRAYDTFRSAMSPFADYPVTLACLAQYAVPEWIEYIKAHPKWRVQCHGLRHARYDVMDFDDAVKELQRAKGSLEQTFKCAVTELYVPYNKYNDSTRDAAHKAGMVEIRGVRTPTHYKKSLGKAGRVDFHYWNPKDVLWAKKVYDRIALRPIFVVGAPRSGTTAYMRSLACVHNAVALKEKEYIWKKDYDRNYYYTRTLIDSGKKHVVDKNCRNSLRLPQILKEFPGAAIHHIVRDGRAVALSWWKWSQKTNKKDQTLRGAAQQWVRYIKYLSADLPESAKEVRYEHLCDTDDSFTSCNYKWQTELTEEQKELVLSIQGPYLKELGYI